MVQNSRIVFVDPHRWRASSLFNGNAFPRGVRADVNASGLRFAQVLFHTDNLFTALDNDIAVFRNLIEERRSDIETGAASRPDLCIDIIYEGMAYLSEMQNTLNALKSFLDIYAKVIGSLQQPMFRGSFSKARVDGKKISGGRLVNALRNSRQNTAANELASLISVHSSRWITLAVGYRDQLSHRSNLDDMRPLSLAVSQSSPHLDATQILSPAMPNGQDILQYFRELRDNLITFVVESMKLLPGIDKNLISTEVFRA